MDTLGGDALGIPVSSGMAVVSGPWRACGEGIKGVRTLEVSSVPRPTTSPSKASWV